MLRRAGIIRAPTSAVALRTLPMLHRASLPPFVPVGVYHEAFTQLPSCGLVCVLQCWVPHGGRPLAAVMSPRTVPQGAFSHSAHTAPLMTLFIPGTPPENHPPTEACMIHSKQHRGCGIQDLGTRGRIRLKRNPWCTSRGCRVQNSGPWDPWLLVVENSRPFAQRGHSARCAPSLPPP